MQKICQRKPVSAGVKLTLPLILFQVVVLVNIVAGTYIDLPQSCPPHSNSCLLTNITDSHEDSLKVSPSQVPELLELVVRDSAIRRIPKALLELAPNLQRLVLHNCGVNSLSDKDFEKCGPLKVLVIQENCIFTVSEKVFQALRNTLEELYLRHNVLHILHRRAFYGLEKLKYLDVPYNGITSLSAGIFDELINLEHVDLSHNQIEMIDANTFAKNLKLTTIMLGDNKFSVFEPNALRHLSHLRLLDLSNTVLEELRLQSVDYLQVSGSGLKHLTIDGGVTKLIAANNSLSGFNISEKLQVQEVQLQANSLTSLDDLQGMLNLRKLDVSHNRLTHLRTTSEEPLYINLPNLEYLNLASNHLRNISSEDFLLMTKLTTLDLAHNHLFQLPSSILEPLKNLQKLHVEGNHLVEFDGVKLKRKFKNLHEITLEQNDWDEQYELKLTSQLEEQAIIVRQRIADTDMDSEISTNLTSQLDRSWDHHEMQRLVGLTGIHPYWTMRDILALITLLIVLLILLLQFFRILQEEQCCRRNRNVDYESAQPLVHDNSLL